MSDIYTAPPTDQSTKAPTEGTETVEQRIDEETAKEKALAEDTVTAVLHRVGEFKRTELWGAYTVRPGKSFLNEEKDEEVVLILRAHPITNLKWIMTTLILLIMPPLIIVTGLTSSIAFKYVFIGQLAWYLVTLGFAFEKFLDWFYSVLIITNERIMDVDFVNLLYRDIQLANLNHIEEPSMVSGGFVRSAFSFGDVSVATAADEPPLEGISIPHPEKVIQIISELSEELEKERGAASRVL